MSARYAPAKGTPPSIEFVELARLNVDATYQRTIETKDSRSIINAIAAAWDWRLCSPLIVSRRLPYGSQGASMLFVIDGQHRLEAARLRGDIAFVPCIITTYASAAEEAELFVAVNQRRRRVSTIETFRAALVAGDAQAGLAAELIASAGLTIPRTGRPESWEPGDLGQVGTVSKGLRRFGREVVGPALVQLAEAFPDEKLDHAGRILDGLFLVYADQPTGFDPDQLFRALLLRDQAQWVSAAMARIAETGETWPWAMKAALLDLYATVPAEREAA